MAQWLANPTRNDGLRVRSLGFAQWVGDLVLLWAVVWVADKARILRCCVCGVGRRLQL